MLPADQLAVSGDGAVVVPRFLTPADWPWLRALLDEYRRYEGRPRRELEARLREPLTVPVSRRRLAIARHVLDRSARARARGAVPPRRIRTVLFSRAASGDGRADAVERAAAELGLGTGEVEARLFADLGSERPVGALPEALSHEALMLEANLALAQGLLARAAEVRVRLRGNARDVVRHAQLRGLICVARRDRGDEERVVLELSGPVTLFRRTLVYGRALGSLLPRLGWCDDWALWADCTLGTARRRVRMQRGAPLPPCAAPRRFDSRLEERFARDLGRASRDWELVREPGPVPSAGRLVFPDFELVHRRDRRRRWLVEIAGFWTPGYLERKLAGLRALEGGLPWILLVDEERACADATLPPGSRVIGFRRRIDAARVLAVLDGAGPRP